MKNIVKRKKPVHITVKVKKSSGKDMLLLEQKNDFKIIGHKKTK
ncbi:MAG: hypothetical protein ACOC2E_09760 [Bacteroidota bacterium]